MAPRQITRENAVVGDDLLLNFTGDGMQVDYALPSATPTAAPVIPDAEDLLVNVIDDGESYTYQCASVVEDNDPTTIPMEFFMDVSFPEGAEKLALRHVREQLVNSVAFEYGISTGQGCENPSLQRTWIVEISSETSDWVRDPVFDTCQELDFNATAQECYVYQAKLTCGVLAGSAADISEFVEVQLQGDGAATLMQNSPYHVQFLGVPQVDPTAGDTGRNNLGSPSNTNASKATAEAQANNRNAFTVGGGLLVAGLCLAFLGLALILYRRRQGGRRQEGLHQRDVATKYDPNTQDLSKDDDTYGQRELHADLYGADDHMEIDLNGQVMLSRDDSEHEKITIDLGSNFKDQLMGVYGSSPAPRRQQRDMYGLNQAGSLDSEVDSWAQTDGTIGSIEQNLDPLTSEV